MYVHHLTDCSLEVGKEGVELPGAGVKDNCEPQCGFWEPNPGPIQKQQVFLTTEQSQLPAFILIN